MIFPQHKQKKQNKVIWVFSIFALLALIFILLKNKTTESFFVSAFSKINFMRSADDVTSREALLFAARIKTLEDENNSLKAPSGHKKPEEVRAEVKLGGGYLFSDILLLNAGKDDGINPGDLVFAGGDIYAGKISETGDGWSKVYPVGRLGDKLNLRSGLNKENTFEAIGTGRGELLAELPKEMPVALGDVVWLGENPVYPAGLVVDIQKSEGREIQEVKIASPLPLESLVSVTVIRNQ